MIFTKMKSPIFLIPILLYSVLSLAGAQVFQNYNQLLVNKYSISPAYAGFTSNKELFVNYRQNWKGIAGAPRERSINFNSPLMGKSGYGAFIKSNSAGIFNYLSAGISYSFDIAINENNHFLAGTSLEYFNNNINVNYSNQSIANDPRIYEYHDKNESYINTSLGIVYVRKNLNIGITLPNLGALYNNSLTTLSNYNIIIVHGSYSRTLSQKFDIETFVTLENYASNAWVYDVAAVVKYNQLLWVGLNYRHPSVYGFIVGVSPLNNILIHYSYETSGNGLVQNSSGNHEITLGLLFGNNKNSKYRKSAFSNRTKEPYNNWTK
jgi:type IX secretion system PorP/SprF family membrane protein